MTTYAYKLVLNDSEVIALEDALEMYIKHCEENLKGGPRAPYWARERAAQEILKKLYQNMEQTSGNSLFNKTE